MFNKINTMLRIISICVLSITGLALSGNEISSTLTHATVYLKGAALRHTAQTTLKSGRQEVVISDLTQHMVPPSLRLKGFGQLTIHSVQHRYNNLRDPKISKRVLVWKDSLTLINDKISEIDDKMWVLESEKSMILASKNTVHDNGNGQSTLELQKKSDFYRTRLTDILQQQSKLKKSKSVFSETQQALKRQIAEAGGRQKRVSEIVIDIESTGGSARFEFSYLVHQAGWVPEYDLRIDKVGEEVEVVYQAAIHQNTGYDWEGIQLSLSTNKPFQNTTKPELQTWALNFIQPLTRPSSQSNRQYSMSKDEAAGATTAPMALSSEDLDDASYIATTSTEAETGMYFDLTDKQRVPHSSKSLTYRITTYKVSASYKHFASPKLSRDVFLLARVYNWETLNLVPGKARIFFENSYVGETFINSQQIGDTLDMSLGIDPGIVLDRKRIKDFSETKILNNTKRETLAIEVKLRNTKSREIQIRLEDQIPVSSNSEIEVELREANGGRLNPSTGMLTWDRKIQPGESLTVQFIYVVKYPKDKKINL
jgi:uncharacterized protein (TIGR02231 family)